MIEPSIPLSIADLEWFLEDEDLDEEMRMDMMAHTISLAVERLNGFSKKDQLVKYLGRLIQSGIDIKKRYFIADTINIMRDNHRGSEIDMVNQLKADILNPASLLFNTLNYQRNAIPVTFFGAMKPISWNYSKSLQEAHSIVLRGNKPEEDEQTIRLSNM